MTFKLTIALSLICFNVSGQSFPGYSAGPGKNPAFSGARGDGTLIMTYSSIYPGSGYNLNRYNLSYDTFIGQIHGGVGFSIVSDQPGGLLNEVNPEFSYSYHLRAGSDLYIFAGMSAGVIYRSFNSSRLIFPDQIDPIYGVILPGGENPGINSSLFFDMSTGFMMIYRNSMVSIDASHLFRPDLSRSGIPGSQLPRIFTLQAFTTINPGNNELMLTPYGEFSAGGGRYTVALGTAINYNVLGMSLMVLQSDPGTSIQTSVSLDTGPATLFYAYRFMAGAAVPGLPFGLMHQTGLRIGLNIVDKRKIIKTIFIPDL